MAMDSAARAEEKREETEEMIKEMRLSFVRAVPLELEKEGVGVMVADDEVDDEVERVEEVEDSVNKSEEVEDDDEERADELVVETKELVGSVEDAVAEEVLFWIVEEELMMLEDELEDTWVEETTELLEADDEEERAEELEDEAAADVELERLEELDDTAEEITLELAFDDEEIALELAFDEETMLELTFADEEGL